MLQAAVPMCFFHESYYGRPSCPRCGQSMIAPESSRHFNGNDIRHSWRCEECDHPFETLVQFSAEAA